MNTPAAHATVLADTEAPTVPHAALPAHLPLRAQPDGSAEVSHELAWLAWQAAELLASQTAEQQLCEARSARVPHPVPLMAQGWGRCRALAMYRCYLPEVESAAPERLPTVLAEYHCPAAAPGPAPPWVLQAASRTSPRS